MLVMVVFFIAFRWIHLSTPLIRLFLLVLILLLMPTLNFLPVWFALSLLRFRLPSRLPMMFILWMVAMMVVIIPSRTVCLSFRMQGVEFDNGVMYVDGHKAASDVRDEFVSVTEKLMDELAQCYNVLPQLDINNTIDHRPEGDEKWFLENEKTVTQFCRKLAAERPLKDIRDEYNYPKKKGIKDECSRLLEASTMKSRRGFAIQRLMNAMRQAHADGWFIVFDT